MARKERPRVDGLASMGASARLVLAGWESAMGVPRITLTIPIGSARAATRAPTPHTNAQSTGPRSSRHRGL